MYTYIFIYDSASLNSFQWLGSVMTGLNQRWHIQLLFSGNSGNSERGVDALAAETEKVPDCYRSNLHLL